MKEGAAISHAPSFNSYTNSKIAEIAARVVEEFDSNEEFFVGRQEKSAAEPAEEGRISDNRDPKSDADVEEDEFEFAVVRNSDLSSPIPADEIFQNGKIRPSYPVFDRDLLQGRVKFENGGEKENGVINSVSTKGPKVRIPLRKLFIEERETTMTISSSSSSDADDLDCVPSEIYCVWRPKEAEEVRCRKSGSAGCCSKRWKLKDLLNKSNSDGSKENENAERRVKETLASDRKVKSEAPPPPCNCDGDEKQMSYLPCRQDFAGFIRNVNGLSKNSQPI